MCWGGNIAQCPYVQPGGPWGHQDPEGRALAPATLQLSLHGESEEAASPGERPVWECSPHGPILPSLWDLGHIPHPCTAERLSARGC